MPGTAYPGATRLLARGRNIYLAGFMGTGKSATARAAARLLGVPWRDLDREIEEEAGMSIAEIFRTRGERAFRAAEHRALSRAASAGGAVVALGGGAVCFPRNRERLRGTGPVVVLTAAPEVIWKRVRGGSERPLLAGEGGFERMRALLARRMPEYRRYRRRVDTGGLRPRAAAAAVLAALEGAHRPASPGGRA
jgi:shikimate kinase